mgnify:CR=1 FL=1
MLSLFEKKKKIEIDRNALINKLVKNEACRGHLEIFISSGRVLEL